MTANNQTPPSTPANAAPTEPAAPVGTSVKGLYTVLFEQLERLRNNSSPEEISRARAVSDIAGRITEVAKVEVAYTNAAKTLKVKRVQGGLLDPLPAGMTMGTTHFLGD